MSFLTSITKLLARHESSLREIAVHEANGNLLKVTLQLTRLRTAKEQLELLTSYYAETLASLKVLDEEGSYQLPMLNHLVAESDMSMEEVGAYTEKFSGFLGGSGQLNAVEFASLENAGLNDIPKDHLVYGILKAYKDYISQEHFLNRIKELMDMLEDNSEGDKLSEEQVKEIKDEKVVSLTAAQKVLAVYYLMRWAGIELGERQGARHQRFIAALTGISSGTVKEKFPTLNVTGKSYHLDNLKAVIPLFESVGALNLVEKIRSDLKFEQDERGQ